MSTITVDFSNKQIVDRNSVIDVRKVSNSRVRIANGLISPAETEVDIEIAEEHKSEPIKDIEDIDRISRYLIKNERYRDNMLFIVGINFGLRISDLLQLRFMHLINDNFTFKTTFPILEKKTKNTRKVKRNRYITINSAVMDAVTLYLEHNPSKLDDYMFQNQSNRKSTKRTEGSPMSRQRVDVILKDIADTLHLNCKIATHSLRKTFGYHQMLMSNNDPRKLLVLQKMFGHSTSAQTLDYIGITGEEIEEAYMKLNLGSRNHYLVDSSIHEGSPNTAS